MKNLTLLLISLFVTTLAMAQAGKENPAPNMKVDKVATKKTPAASKDPAKTPAGSAQDRKAASDEDDIMKYMPTHFKKGWKVEVIDYDEAADAFDIAHDGEKETGPFYFTPDEFLKATGESISASALTLQKKRDFVGAERVLKADMKFLTFEEYLARGGKEAGF